MKKITLLCIVTMLCIFCFCGCSEETTVSEATTPQGTTESIQATAEYLKNDEEVFEIKTPYCSLYYPTKWKDSIKTEVTSDEPCVVKFKALLGGKEYSLFDVSFGKTEKGYLLGSLPTDSESVDVYLIDHSEKFPKDLTEENKNNLNAMANDVNVLISELVYASGMTTY